MLGGSVRLRCAGTTSMQLSLIVHDSQIPLIIPPHWTGGASFQNPLQIVKHLTPFAWKPLKAIDAMPLYRHTPVTLPTVVTATKP